VLFNFSPSPRVRIRLQLRSRTLREWHRVFVTVMPFEGRTLPSLERLPKISGFFRALDIQPP
jgi:hypothetical protein